MVSRKIGDSGGLKVKAIKAINITITKIIDMKTIHLSGSKYFSK